MSCIFVCCIKLYFIFLRLLKESLGGNAKTTMLATIAPSQVYASETLSTLRYLFIIFF